MSPPSKREAPEVKNEVPAVQEAKSIVSAEPKESVLGKSTQTFDYLVATMSNYDADMKSHTS